MPHPLVLQLRFTRSEFVRGLAGISPADAVRRIPPMNCLSWVVGHLANQENLLWNLWAQDKALYPSLRALVGNGSPPSTPPLDEMWAAWREITSSADAYLDTLTTQTLQTHLDRKDMPFNDAIGTLLQRNIYHYWFHTGEAAGIRQALGHSGLPSFVGDLGGQAPYLPE